MAVLLRCRRLRFAGRGVFNSENRAWRFADNFFCHASHQEPSQSGSSVGRHYDVVDALILREASDCRTRRSGQDMASHWHLGVVNFHLCQHSDQLFMVRLRQSVVELAAAVGQWWFLNMEQNQLATMIPG